MDREGGKKMPYIIITMWCPGDKAPEMAKRNLEIMERYPPDENLGNIVVPAAVKSTEQGLKCISIFEPKEGKLEEAYVQVVSAMLMYRSIQGFEYTMDIFFKRTEAFAVIGMNLPK